MPWKKIARNWWISCTWLFELFTIAAEVWLMDGGPFTIGNTHHPKDQSQFSKMVVLGALSRPNFIIVSILPHGYFVAFCFRRAGCMVDGNRHCPSTGWWSKHTYNLCYGRGPQGPALCSLLLQEGTYVRHDSEKYFFRFYTSILQYYRPIIPYYR